LRWVVKRNIKICLADRVPGQFCSKSGSGAGSGCGIVALNTIVTPLAERTCSMSDHPTPVRIEVRQRLGGPPVSAPAAGDTPEGSRADFQSFAPGISSAGQAIVRSAAALGITGLAACRIVHLYFLERDPGDEALARLCALLLADPVLEVASWRSSHTENASAFTPGAGGVHVVEVAFRPGVTDVAARELARGMAEIGLPACAAATGTRYELQGELSDEDLRRLARGLLCNTTVEHYSLGPIAVHFGEEAEAADRVEIIPLRGLPTEALLALSKQRLLSLDASELLAIQRFYSELGRDPTDVELETLAQTWSEHCVHKTFKALIDFTWLDAAGNVRSEETVDGLIYQYLAAATERVRRPWLRSAFVDNAGIIAFDDEYDLAFKVETHNHPSALEPFGGANTGVGGVVRDIIGVSARPIANTNVLCFGPQDFGYDLLPEGVLHPQRIAEGVVSGIADYGNKLGIPTVNGSVIYDAGYLGNPLVFCGCAGLLPVGKHPRAAAVGDLVVAIGGRTGRDGIHGATFSSAELTHETAETAGSAVQIGDPITEKGLIEVVELARDRGLYTAITDCGAGGFSSAVGEMGEALGVEVDLANAPLKYGGLAPWEIWISEAQERMVLAVPPGSLAELKELSALWDVELCVLGAFTGDRLLRVCFEGRAVAELPMSFLHDGLPRRRMTAVYKDPPPGESPGSVLARPQIPAPGVSGDEPLGEGRDLTPTLLALLGHPSLASKEAIVRRYDHEVRGGTIVRPFVGPHGDGPADAAVLKPLGTWGHRRAFALSAGVNPLLGRADPYAMAVSAVDEAIRNAVAVGADPQRIAILDNFCWGNPTFPDRLGSLVRACQGCYDAAVAYGTPYISGKDSLYNEFAGNPIPGTLLISAIGIVPDLQRCVTADFKQAGNRIYLLGETLPELGGSLLHHLLGVRGGVAPGLPAGAPALYGKLHAAITAGLVAAAHDLSEGGLAVALSEMCLGGRLGAQVALDGMLRGTEADEAAAGTPALDVITALFGESNGRLLVEVAEEDGGAFEALLDGAALLHLGVVVGEGRLTITESGHTLAALPLERLVAAWKGGE
jgi:phosphoribosylformylglycinamidine synthase